MTVPAIVVTSTSTAWAVYGRVVTVAEGVMTVIEVSEFTVKPDAALPPIETDVT